MRVNPASGTETVSFMGGFSKLRFIFPDSFRSITSCFLIVFPIIQMSIKVIIRSFLYYPMILVIIPFKHTILSYPCLNLGLYENYFCHASPLPEHKKNGHEDAKDDLRHTRILGRLEIFPQRRPHLPVLKNKFISITK